MIFVPIKKENNTEFSFFKKFCKLIHFEQTNVKCVNYKTNCQYLCLLCKQTISLYHLTSFITFRK